MGLNNSGGSKRYRSTIGSLCGTSMMLLACSLLAQESATSPDGVEASQSRKRDEALAPVLSVEKTERATEDRPVLSVNQQESTGSDLDKPVLFLDPFEVAPAPAGSPLDQTEESSLQRSATGEGKKPPTVKLSKHPTLPEQRKWSLQFRSRLGVAYDDNIYISNTNRVGDTILTLTGGVSFLYGDWLSKTGNFLVADYEASGLFYMENSSQNSLNQIATLMGQYRIERLTAQLRSQYFYLTGADRDVGDLTARNLINNSLRLSYDAGAKTTLFSEGFANLALYQGLFNSYEFGAKTGADYQVLQKVRVGPEAVIGFLNVEDSPFQIYQQLRARVSYATTAKLSFEGSAGVEFRQFSSQSRTYFVFSLAAEYRPFDSSVVSLRGYRTLYGSAALEGQDFIATGVELSLSQRFFHRFYLSIATGYENDQYIAITQNVQAGRVDNFVFVRPALTFAFTKWGSVNLFYEFRKNFSNEFEFAFYDNRVGAALAFQL
jgi:hypothetical protein